MKAHAVATAIGWKKNTWTDTSTAQTPIHGRWKLGAVTCANYMNLETKTRKEVKNAEDNVLR